MPDVSVKFHPFESLADATKVADDIRRMGDITVTDSSGATYNVSIDDVTVNK